MNDYCRLFRGVYVKNARALCMAGFIDREYLSVDDAHIARYKDIAENKSNIKVYNPEHAALFILAGKVFQAYMNPDLVTMETTVSFACLCLQLGINVPYGENYKERLDVELDKARFDPTRMYDVRWKELASSVIQQLAAARAMDSDV